MLHQKKWQHLPYLSIYLPRYLTYSSMDSALKFSHEYKGYEMDGLRSSTGRTNFWGRNHLITCREDSEHPQFPEESFKNNVPLHVQYVGSNPHTADFTSSASVYHQTKRTYQPQVKFPGKSGVLSHMLFPSLLLMVRIWGCQVSGIPEARLNLCAYLKVLHLGYIDGYWRASWQSLTVGRDGNNKDFLNRDLTCQGLQNIK